MHGPRVLISLVLGAALAALSAPAAAQVTEIYKCLDPTGRPLYTSDKKDTEGKKCELVSREINVVPAQRIPIPRAAPAVQGHRRPAPEERRSAEARAR